MKRLVLTQRDFSLGHFLGESCLLHVTELFNLQFDGNGKLLLSPIGNGNEPIQLAQLKQPADITDTAIVGLSQNKMQSAQKSM